MCYHVLGWHRLAGLGRHEHLRAAAFSWLQVLNWPAACCLLLAVQAARQAYVEELRAGRAAAPDEQLCATPFGVDVVGITEFVALTGALVGGACAVLLRAAGGRMPALLLGCCWAGGPRDMTCHVAWHLPDADTG